MQEGFLEFYLCVLEKDNESQVDTDGMSTKDLAQQASLVKQETQNESESRTQKSTSLSKKTNPIRVFQNGPNNYLKLWQEKRKNRTDLLLNEHRRTFTNLEKKFSSREDNLEKRNSETPKQQ